MVLSRMRQNKFERSATYLGVFLLFSLLYTQTFTYFIGLEWKRSFSVLLYVLIFVWLAILLFKQKLKWWSLTKVDLFVLFFWSTVGLSIIFRTSLTLDLLKYLLYVPFMVFIPYFCGRLIRVSDFHIFMRIMLILGLLIIPLMIADRVYSTANPTVLVRWPIFGHDYGRLMVGSLLACALTATCFFVTSVDDTDWSRSWIKKLVLYGCTVLITFALVATATRGIILSGILGAIVVVLCRRNSSLVRRFCVSVTIVVLVVVAHFSFSAIDPHYFLTAQYSESNFKYENSSTLSSLTRASGANAQEILASPGCRAMRGADSVNVRELLYREAVAMFLSHPLVGVGATKFGEYSCWSKVGSYPHSTVLQVLAELGLLGGGVFVMCYLFAFRAQFRLAILSKDEHSVHAIVGAFALLILFFAADQIYGNYFMATGTWLMLGVSSSVQKMVTLADANE